ncbi:MAG: branched-chain amino acid ABC transporter permease [Hyphomicrobiaceae bacterium]
MAMDVIAASRADHDDATPWGHVGSTGLYLGIAVLALCMVGVLNIFTERSIVVGYISLAYAMLGFTLLAAGVMVAQRGLLSSPAMCIVGGAVAGAIAAVFGAALAVIMSLVNLRFIFVAMEPKLLKLLTFGLQPPILGALALIALGAALGAFGALIVVLPRVVRRPVVAALIGAGMAGLFQELIRIILVNNIATKWLHDLLYTYTGLTLQGAVIMAVASAVGIMAYDAFKGGLRAAGVDMAATEARLRLPLMILTLVIIGLFPLYGGNFVGQVFLMVGFFVLMGMGLNLEVGLAGLLDLGFVAFYAVGAYVTALLMADHPYSLAQNFGWEWAKLSYWEAMPIAILASIIVGVLFGVPVLKVRGDYLAVATLGLGEIVRVIVLSEAAAPLLGGSQGILQIPRPVVFGQPLNDQVSLFYVVFFGSLLAAYVAWRLENSRLGRAWTAIRDDEDVAQALGINLIQVKLLAYGLGAAFAGFAGSIFAVLVGSIFPHSFQLIISINVLALIIVGGMGSLPGVVLGSAVLIGLPEMLREFGEFRYLFYGLAIVAVTRLKPEGLWPSAARRRELRMDAEAAALETGAVTEKAA